MLPAALRMRRSDDFARTIRSGARGNAPRVVVHLSVDAAPDRGARGSQHAVGVQPRVPLVGFVVSRAVGPAVVRTTVKRRLRHQMAERIATLPAGAHVVVRALPATAGATSGQLGSDLDRALSTAARRSTRPPRRTTR